MKSTTLTFKVSGDSYEELIKAADASVNKFLTSSHDEDFEDENGSTDSLSSVRVSYELVVAANEDIASDYEYTAEVIAKMRDK